MSVERTRLREEATASRERIVSTVGELRGAADQAKTDVIAGAKRNAPIAGAVFAGLILLRLAIARGRQR